MVNSLDWWKVLYLYKFLRDVNFVDITKIWDFVILFLMLSQLVLHTFVLWLLLNFLDNKLSMRTTKITSDK